MYLEITVPTHIQVPRQAETLGIGKQEVTRGMRTIGRNHKVKVKETVYNPETLEVHIYCPKPIDDNYIFMIVMLQ